jgi:hypothetical protein
MWKGDAGRNTHSAKAQDKQRVARAELAGPELAWLPVSTRICTDVLGSPRDE